MCVDVLLKFLNKLGKFNIMLGYLSMCCLFSTNLIYSILQKIEY